MSSPLGCARVGQQPARTGRTTVPLALYGADDDVSDNASSGLATVPMCFSDTSK
jgi:hypothetical protein